MSDPTPEDRAARLLNGAARDGGHVAALPEQARPASIAAAHAIQARLVALSGEAVAGWKVATNAEGVAMWGAIYRKDCFASPARVPAARMPLRGVEGEVAFRFTRDLAARAEPYSRAEIEAAVVAFAAIEIVDSRFASYTDTPVVDRLADRMSNGGMVLGSDAPDWRALDLADIHVTLARNGETVVDRRGGHARGDPLLPVLDFIHATQAGQSFRAGEFITAGTFTGLIFADPGDRFEVAFTGLGGVALAFE